MLLRLLMAVVRDLVFDAAAAQHTTFDAEMERYLDRHGPRADRPPRAPAR